MSTWTLTHLYPTEQAFEQDLERVASLFEKKAPSLEERIHELQEAGMLLHELKSYVECRMAQDTADQDAQVKNGTLATLRGKNEAALFELGFALSELSDSAFEALLVKVAEMGFFVTELRDLAKKKGSREKEQVIGALSADGYHSFWSLYQTYTGKMRIEGQSVGQAFNLLTDPDRSVRIKAFTNWSKAWEKEAPIIAQFLNSLAGFRLSVYESRGWDSVLEEPLMTNRMQKETLDSMFAAINEAKPHLLKFLEKKASLMGLEKLSWVDVESPLGGHEKISWDDAKEEILKAFERVHPEMAAFSKGCFEKQWIDAQDREGKAAGGFCTHFPKSKETRIFMTYQGTPFNVATLAHELGHAYHNKCVENLPFFLQQLRMNVAETASTFAEMVALDAAILNARSDQEKQILLEDKLQRTVAYLLNLQSRLIFETNFYEERRKGFVSADRLCSLMIAAQKEAYGESLADWDPYFWAMKLHFYYTYYPFYNFPYTFGYLLSNGLYTRCHEEHFPEKFDAFLADTGQMQVEDLAQKHLGVDLKKPTFWQESIGVLVKDIEQFLRLPS